MNKRALITGITGQDGSYLAKLLLSEQIDPSYFRPSEVKELCGDATKARECLGWGPVTAFAELVRLMVQADLRDAGLDPDAHMVAVAAGAE